MAPRREPWRPTSPRARYLRWRLLGMDRAEAGNLTAWSLGVPPIVGGWTPEEMAKLLFLAWMVRTGRTPRG